MVPQQWRRLCRAVLSGFLIGSGAIGLAQDNSSPGIVRITDSRPRGVPVQNTGFGHHGHGEYIGSGEIISGDCPECYGGYGKHGCYRGCRHCLGNCLFGPPCIGQHCCLREHYGSLSPDNGFSPPAKFPIQRRGVQYSQYYPAAWYGTPGGGLQAAYPMVYQPTDTTQLGYYYQHVPFWMPNPNALPQRPIPAQWHTFAPASTAGVYSPGFGFGTGFCPPGNGVITNGTVTEGTVISPTPASPAPMQPQTSPVTPQLEQAPPPSAPPVEGNPPSAQNLPILRAGF
jgi:hypothetical protein